MATIVVPLDSQWSDPGIGHWVKAVAKDKYLVEFYYVIKVTEADASSYDGYFWVFHDADKSGPIHFDCEVAHRGSFPFGMYIFSDPDPSDIAMLALVGLST